MVDVGSRRWFARERALEGWWIASLDTVFANWARRHGPEVARCSFSESLPEDVVDKATSTRFWSAAGWRRPASYARPLAPSQGSLGMLLAAKQSATSRSGYCDTWRSATFGPSTTNKSVKCVPRCRPRRSCVYRETYPIVSVGPTWQQCALPDPPLARPERRCRSAERSGSLSHTI